MSREQSLADALKLVLDDWANANAIGDDARKQAERALDAPSKEGSTFHAIAWGDRIRDEQLDELLARAEKAQRVVLRIDQFRDLVLQAKALRPEEKAIDRNAIIEECARVVEKLSTALYHEFGGQDPETGAWDIGHRFMETVEAYDEAMNAIRALASAPSPQKEHP